MASETPSKTASETTSQMAEPVRLEPCGEFLVDDDAQCETCAACGWLEDDHTRVDAGSAIVTVLPRPSTDWSERKAS